MDNRITPEMAKQELARRNSLSNSITPEMARAELERREKLKQSETNDTQEQLKKLFGIGNTPFGNIKDILSGVAESGQNVANLLTGGRATKYNFGDENTNSLLKEIGKNLPAAITGGTSLIPQIISQAISGFINTNPQEKNALGFLPQGRVGGAIENALSTAALGGSLKSLPLVKNNIINKISPLLKASNPEENANNIMQQLSKGESPEESGKNLASLINKKYQDIFAREKNKFTDLFNLENNGKKLGEEKIYNTPNAITGAKREGKYIDLTEDNEKPFSYTYLNNLHKSFLENPTINKAHDLQSAIGEEIGYLQNQKKLGNLDDSGKNELNKYIKARSALRNDIKDKMKNINDSIPEAYDAYTQDWKNEIIPYHSDLKLKNIAQGITKNPTRSEIQNIFQNPEENIQKVINDIGEEGKSRISYLGLNKLPSENKPTSLIKAKKNLEKKGLSSYLSPEQNESFNQLEEQNRNFVKRKNLLKALRHAAFGAAGLYGAEKVYNKLL